MAVKTKIPHRASDVHTVGRRGFAKISAIEGITLSHEVEEAFRAFDRQGLSLEERRKALLRRYGRKV